MAFLKGLELALRDSCYRGLLVQCCHIFSFLKTMLNHFTGIFYVFKYDQIIQFCCLFVCFLKKANKTYDLLSISLLTLQNMLGWSYTNQPFTCVREKKNGLPRLVQCGLFSQIGRVSGITLFSYFCFHLFSQLLQFENLVSTQSMMKQCVFFYITDVI